MQYDSTRTYKAELKVSKNSWFHWTDWLVMDAGRLAAKYQRLAELADDEVALVVWSLDKTHCVTDFDEGAEQITLETQGVFTIFPNGRGWSLIHELRAAS